MKVVFANYLKREFVNFDEAIKNAVDEFVFYATYNNLRKLQGRNKSSALPNPTTKKEHEHTKFAQKYCLYHYHLGVPHYIEQANGDKTSQYILHYCYYDDVIVLVDISTHPPFHLPSIDKLSYEP